MNKHQEFLKQRESEKICDVCGLTMKVERRKRKSKFSKERTVYFCECGHRFRKRTQNEILRDIGLKD